MRVRTKTGWNLMTPPRGCPKHASAGQILDLPEKSVAWLVSRKMRLDLLDGEPENTAPQGEETQDDDDGTDDDDDQPRTPGQCQGITRSGAQCRNAAVEDGDFCAIHDEG